MVRQDRSTVTIRHVSLGASLILLSALAAACLILASQSLASADPLPQRPFSVAFDDAPADGGASPTPTPSCQLYSYTLGDGTPIGGTYDIGNHCDFCGTLINLPFPVTMYGQTFITATVTSKGLLAFGFAHTAYNVECLPFSNSTYAMAPFWVDQWTATNVCPLCGIFTNTVGTAPNRTFIVEWRTLYFNQRDMPPTLNYEIQLQEGQSSFKYVYKLVTSYSNADTSLTIGTQLSRNLDIYTEYYCDPTGETAPPLTGKQLTWVYDPCGTPIASATSTPTPIATGTLVPTATPTSCPDENYIAFATPGPIEPGDTFVPGSNCDDCSVDIPLPFSYSLYDQTYATVRLYANGMATFGNSPTMATSCLPVAGAAYTIFAHGDDLLLTSPGDGIYTSTTGTAPNRIFTMEWRGCYYNGGTCGAEVNFALSLDEGLRRFELSYGTTPQTINLAGVQRDAVSYTQYQCGGSISGSVIFVLDDCATPGGTATVTPTRTPTGTATPFTPGPTNTSAGCFDNGSVPVTCTPTPIVTNTATNTHTPLPTQTPAGPSATPEASNTSTPEATITPTTCSIQFTDVPADHTFYPHIMCLACRDIISGYASGCETGDPCFRPGNNVTRGQIAKIVSNAAGFKDPVTGQTFEDVPPGHTFYEYVERMASRGIMSGYPIGTNGCPQVPPSRPCFLPGRLATRGQLSKIVSNAANYQEPVTGQTFEDVPPGHTFYDFIERLATREVMSGYACGGLSEPCVPPDNRPYFRPAANVTRGQTSKIVANTFFPECAP